MRALTKWRKAGTHEFRRVRPDDELGETMRFEMGPDGKATAFWLFSNRYARSRSAPQSP